MSRVPPYTREQVARRRRVALGVLTLVLLVAVASCGASVSRMLSGGEQDSPREGTARTPARTRTVEPDALQIPETPAEAAAMDQLPPGTSVESGEALGIDVSAHQGAIDWPRVREAGISFAYIKATEGVGHLDERLNRNWAGAHRAGIARGAYHYFTLCSGGLEQAESFLAAVPPDDSVLPPALDLELDGNCGQMPEASEVADEVDAFIAAVEKSWGRRVVVYSSQQWRDTYPIPEDVRRPMWISSLGQRPEEEWALWQTRFDASLSGVSGDVDLDVLRIDQLAREARLGEH